MCKFKICFVILFCLFIFILNTPKIKASILCLKETNCSSCIQKSYCAWCSDKNFIARTGRKCDLVQRLIEDGCSKKYIYNPKTIVNVLDEKSILSENSNPKLLSRNNRNFFLNMKKNLNQSKLVQLKPEKIKIYLRPNSKVKFNLTFEQIEKYPLDIYYLMDLTWSMKDHKDALIKLANKIGESMSNITKNFRLGFGSFIDKVVMPYSNMIPKKLKNPCKDNFACVPAYGFRNHLPLTKDVNSFLKHVQEAQLSGNLDNAEGGFDAIMQVITCKNQINWSYPSRKIILFATDSIFHYAGDGKLGGIVKPNDGICHLDNDGFYTESILQDYPTLEQINKAIVANQINIIFSVPRTAFKVYETLSANLQGSVTGELAENSSNIVHLIRENYKKIVSTIELKHNASKEINLKFYSACLSNNVKQTNICSNVDIGQKVEFQVELEVNNCSDLINKKKKFIIFPLGIEEYTEIELEMICNCECENELETSSKSCSHHGSLQCGVCTCDPTYYGDYCECSLFNLTSYSSRKCDFCKKGKCNCGSCLCDKKNDEFFIYGKNCECDTYSCLKNKQNEICSGKGRCCNNKCECFTGWTGEACDCPLDDTLCMNPFNDKVCSGQGECICGKCQCKINNSTENYVGKYCNECPTCEDECVVHDACVLCTAFNSGPFQGNCKENCKFDMAIVSNFDHILQENLNNEITDLNRNNTELTSEFLFDKIKSKSQFKRCVMIDEENCKYEFVHIFSPLDSSTLITILKDKKCPEVINVFYLMLIIVVSILLIGILILCIWKIIAIYEDRKGYKEWLKELNKHEYTSTGKNPLYKAPETIYKNPIYESKTS